MVFARPRLASFPGVSFPFALFFALVVLLSFGPLTRRVHSQEEGDKPPAPGEGKDDAKKEGSEPEAKPLSIDEAYIRDNLETHLLPTKVEFLKDGRVKLVFDFTEKKKEHETIFKPPVQQNINSTFRWTVRGEEYYYGGYGGAYNTEKKIYGSGGLRISDGGVAILNCWFLDDVEAEVVFHQGTSFSPNNFAALIFCNEQGDALGSNFGTQAAVYKKGKPTSKRQGAPEGLNIYESTKFKLVVRGGMFEAYRSARKKAELAYVQKSYKSARLGFLWGGRVAGMISSLEIVGRIDAAKMAKELQKGSRG